jgi:periplasmic divalent cation tolerance protein
MECRIVITTYPDQMVAEKVAKDSIKARLAVCANIAKVRSVYVWKGKIEDIEESLVLFKTAEKVVNELKSFIKKSHPYQVPEIVEITPKYVDPGYLLWLDESIGS